MPPPAAAPDRLLPVHDLHPPRGDMHAEVVEGLSASPKTLPCKYFYDEQGSHLFDRICELDEYYVTRTEIGILERVAPEIANRLGPDALILELGSGSSTKTHILLDALERPAGYVPIDISKEHLRAAAARVRGEFPHVPVHPVCADFTEPLELPRFAHGARQRFVYFPGSTIGNFDPEGQRRLLRRVAPMCQPEGGGLLIGIDLIKDVRILEAAYDDAEGVTAEFNLNLLERLNRDIGTDFDRSRFAHRALYNREHDRIEMHLVSQADQAVALDDERFRLEEGETICTEHSHKFSVGSFSALAAEVGLELDGIWFDPDELFAILLLRTRG
jgi:dimethylhistidine N-methyltransferase